MSPVAAIARYVFLARFLDILLHSKVNVTVLCVGGMALRAWHAWKKKQATISDEHEHREPKSVNVFLGFFFLVNYSLAAGLLATPYSFLHAGYLVAIPTLLVIVFVTWIHASWVLEVMARAQVRWEGSLFFCSYRSLRLH